MLTKISVAILQKTCEFETHYLIMVWKPFLWTTDLKLATVQTKNVRSGENLAYSVNVYTVIHFLFARTLFLRTCTRKTACENFILTNTSIFIDYIQHKQNSWKFYLWYHFCKTFIVIFLTILTLGGYLCIMINIKMVLNVIFITFSLLKTCTLLQFKQKSHNLGEKNLLEWQWKTTLSWLQIKWTYSN